MPRGVYERKPKKHLAQELEPQATIVDLIVTLDRMLPKQHRERLRKELEMEVLRRRIRELQG